MLRRLNQDLLKSLQSQADEKARTIPLNWTLTTPEGLSINVFDRSHKPIFEHAIDQIHPVWRLGFLERWPGKFHATTI